MTAASSSTQNIGYMRVSTPEQRMDRQSLGLKELCDTLYFENTSAIAKRRPVFEEALGSLQSGDTFVVWDLDRAFRSTVDAILTAEKLRDREVSLKIVSFNIDTTTPEGEVFYTMMAALAQYERRMLSRRTKEGMIAAKRRGAQIGRPRALCDKTIKNAHDYLLKTGYPKPYIAALLDVSPITLNRGFKRLDLTH